MGAHKEVWVLDLEYRQHPYRYAGGAAVRSDGNGKYTIEHLRREADLDRFIRRKSKRLVYAHWGARADFPIVLDRAARWGSGARGGIYVSGGLIRFWVGDTEYRDSIRLLIRGVATVGKAIGIKKEPLPYSKIFSASLDRRCEAASNHAFIVLRALEMFSQRLRVDLDRVPLTAGAAAVHDIDRFIAEEGIREGWPGLTGEAAAFAGLAGYGGRTEVFCRGLYRRVRIYDFSSSYPASFLDEIPVGEGVFTRRIDDADVATCEVIVPDMMYPPLPFRHDGTLFFPTGRMFGTWAGEEIRYAMTKGARITKLYSAMRFKERIHVGKWVTDHYEARASDPFAALYTKILLNAFIGKTRQNRPQSIVGYGEASGKKRDLGSGYWIMDLEPKAPRFQNFIVSAVALSRARIRLHGLFEMAHPVILGDTDGAGTRRSLATSEGLGGLHVESENIDVLTVAPKVYVKKERDAKAKMTFKIKGAVKSTKWMSARERRAATKKLERLLAGKTVNLKRIPTQMQIWEKGKLDFEDWTSYRLHLDRIKRSYYPSGRSRPFSSQEIIDGAYEKPIEDRRIFERIMKALKG